MNVLQTYAAMDGEIVNSLLTLLDKCVAEQLPSKVFGMSVNLLHGLIHRHGAYGHRTVAHNPLSCLVNICSCRQVHQRVATPLAAPHSLLNLLVYARSCGRIAYVCVDFHKEIAAYNHRFCLGMVDVCRNYGASGGNLAAHKLRSDVRFDAKFLAVHVLTYGYILHFRGYYALLCIVKLAHLAAFLSPERQGYMLKAERIERVVITPHASVFRRNLLQAFHSSTLQYPRFAQSRQAFAYISGNVRVAVRTGSIINIHRRIRTLRAFVTINGNRGSLLYDTHAHTNVGKEFTLEVNFL